jgi:hypothetical protein
MKLKMKGVALLILGVMGSFSFPAFAQAWDLNDVSYLFPLPTSATDANYLKAKDFVPYPWFTTNLADADGFPFALDSTQLSTSTIDQFRSIASAGFNSIRLLAVRIDPCFRDLYSDPCRPQIRAIWQPVDGSFSTVDASMHTFYDFNKEEFQNIANQLQQLKTKYGVVTQGLPLQIHPGFKQSGFSKDFFALLKTFLRQDHLTRIAFMKLLGAEFQWRFQGFNVKDGKLVPIEIPLHSDVQQTFAVHGGGIPPGTLELSSEDLSRVQNGEDLNKVLLDYALRIENPRINIPGVTDCLSCHAAGGVKGSAAAALQLNPIPTVAAVVGLIGKYNLQNVTNDREDPIHFRGFGFVFGNASISDRVIIESAMVADLMNR